MRTNRRILKEHLTKLGMDPHNRGKARSPLLDALGGAKEKNGKGPISLSDRRHMPDSTVSVAARDPPRI